MNEYSFIDEQIKSINKLKQSIRISQAIMAIGLLYLADFAVTHYQGSLTNIPMLSFKLVCFVTVIAICFVLIAHNEIALTHA